MRIYLGLLTLALLTATSDGIEPAAAQECDPTVCANPLRDIAKRKKPHAAKPAKTPEREKHMRY